MLKHKMYITRGQLMVAEEADNFCHIPYRVFIHPYAPAKIQSVDCHDIDNNELSIYQQLF